jgi:hypothetical protein
MKKSRYVEEALDVSVLHRPAGLDVHQSDLPVLGPAQQAMQMWKATNTSAQPRLRRLRDNLKAKPKPGNCSYQWMRNRGHVTAL